MASGGEIFLGQSSSRFVLKTSALLPAIPPLSIPALAAKHAARTGHVDNAILDMNSKS